jgi:hypothetical protein
MNEKDLVLKTMISHPEKNAHFSYESLRKHIFPEWNFDEMKFLIDSIVSEKPELLKVIEYTFEGGSLLQPSGLIPNFLKNGGFTKIEKDREIERIK